MKKIKRFMVIQIDDVDDDKVYYSAQDELTNTPFPPSDNHPTALYMLVKNK